MSTGFSAGCAQHRVHWHQPRVPQDGAEQRIAIFYGQWKDTPYLLGGESKSGIDCSAFMQRLYVSLYGIHLPRTTREQIKVGFKVLFNELQLGDLLFFAIGDGGYHVGMYLGENRFLHAGESTGVTISLLVERHQRGGGYWRRHYVEARRIEQK